MWLGYSDIETDGVWVDHEGKPPAKTYWAPDEPKYWRGRKNCLMVGFTKYDTWHAGDCRNHRIPYACQFPKEE